MNEAQGGADGGMAIADINWRVSSWRPNDCVAVGRLPTGHARKDIKHPMARSCDSTQASGGHSSPASAA
jgi:hypothetical protein